MRNARYNLLQEKERKKEFISSLHFRSFMSGFFSPDVRTVTHTYIYVQFSDLLRKNLIAVYAARARYHEKERNNGKAALASSHILLENVEHS